MTKETTEPRTLCYSAGCSWCCGLNTLRNTKSEFEQILRNRTQLYKQMVGTEKGIPKYLKKIDKIEQWNFADDNRTASCEEILRCRLIGFVDEKETKTGCLAYPSKNSPEDPRLYHTDMHEAMRLTTGMVMANVCSLYKCPAADMYSRLPDSKKDIIDLFLEDVDWYTASASSPAKIKKASDITILQKLTTLTHFEYALGRLEERGLAKDKKAVKRVINNIGKILHDLETKAKELSREQIVDLQIDAGK